MRDFEDSSSNPRIVTSGETIRAAYGERVQLPCQVQDLGNISKLFGVNLKYVDILRSKNCKTLQNESFEE